VRPVLGAIVAALLAGGCVLTSAALEVGRDREDPTGYREVQLSGTTLQIRYKTGRWVKQSSSTNAMTIEETPDRWTSVPLESLPWVALDRLGSDAPSQWVPRDCSMTRSTPDPAPAMTLHAYRSPFKGWYSPDAPDYEAPIAAYVDQGYSRRLVLVRASPVDGQRVVTSLLAQISCYDDRPWAPYARVALVPFAVVADIITSPVQLFYYLKVLGAIGTGH